MITYLTDENIATIKKIYVGWAELGKQGVLIATSDKRRELRGKFPRDYMQAHFDAWDLELAV